MSQVQALLNNSRTAARVLATALAPIALIVVVLMAVSTSLSCRSRTPYKRMIVLLDPAPGIEVIGTKDWNWQGCAATAEIPNAYLITRPSYVLVLAHSAQAHTGPGLFLAASGPDRRPLKIEGPGIREIDGAVIGLPDLSMFSLGLPATHYSYLSNVTIDSGGILSLVISDGSVLGQEQLKYRGKFIDCVEYEGP